MKKIVTFSNFIGLLGIMTILFYFIPAIRVEATTQFTIDINLFKAIFGGPIKIVCYDDTISATLVTCSGLVAAFCLGVVGILFTFLKNKFKIATLFACPFYVAAGALVACSSNLVNAANFGISTSIFKYVMLGGAITVAVSWCVLGFFALIDFISVVAIPKQKPANY